MKSMRNSLNYSHVPTREVADTVDVEQLSENNVRRSSRRNCKTQYEEHRTDNDVIIKSIEICTMPDDLPKEVGSFERLKLYIGQRMYATKFSLLKPWCKCKIQNIKNNQYLHIKVDTEERLLKTSEIAYFKTSSVQFSRSTRVIAKLSETETEILDNYYAGVIAEPPKLLNKFRYLVFFDNGNVRYCNHKDIRLIVHQSQNYDQNHYQEFILNCLKNYPECQMMRLKKDQLVRVKFDKTWTVAKVIEVDASIVKLYYTDFNKSEWLYRGSPRLWKMFEKLSKSEKDISFRQSGLAKLKKPFVMYSNVENSEILENTEYVEKESNRAAVSYKNVARKRSSKNTEKKTKEVVDLMPKHINTTSRNLSKPISISPLRPKRMISHTCSHSCVKWTSYNFNDSRKFSMLATPLQYGYNRYISYYKTSESFKKVSKCVMYRTPCGRMIRNLNEMYKYLVITENKMTIDQFDFSSWVEPFAEYKVLKCVRFLEDLSEGKEFRPITCVNTINKKMPPPMEYITARQAMPGVNINVDRDFLCGCDCTDNCQDKDKCACWQMTNEGQNSLPNFDYDTSTGYHYRRLPERVLSGIYECNQTCKCNSSCLNRVVQQPLSQKLQLFMTEKKGWGLRTLNDIPQGSFICNYIGCLFTENDAIKGSLTFGDQYLADLDFIEVVENTKEDYENKVHLARIWFSDNSSNNKKIDEGEKNVESSDEENPDKYSLNSCRQNKKLKTEKKQYAPKSSTINAHDLKMNPVKPTRKYFGDNESVYIMDAKTRGNIGRYMNHSCSPNTFVQNVFVDTHDIRFPWICFFALHYIRAGAELTWDYNYDVGSVPGKVINCQCQSVDCRKRLL